MTRQRLLIVEDSELSRELLVQIFEETYELELAADGETGVKAAATTTPDLILLDIGLPGLSGLDAARAIRDRDAGIPIIAVSAGAMPGDRERALAAGCDDFVAKPIDEAVLIGIVERHLRTR